MNRFTCFVRALGPGVAIPPLFTNLGGAPLSDAFSVASGGRLQLNVDLSLIASPFAVENANGETESFWLHQATSATLGNSPTADHVLRIALLLGNYYTYRPALGVMFDRGFATFDDPIDPASNLQLVGRPREACAVFLGAITDVRRRPNGQIDLVDWDSEVLFTTIHELGHIFNLVHVFSPRNYLAQSAAPGALPLDFATTYLRFLPAQQAELGADPLPLTTLPGGSEFRDHGVHGEHTLPRARGRAPRPFGLELRVDMARRQLHYFEPAELDVELRVVPGVTRRFSVPDELDPGYESFRIWIEEPGGERRLYRCPRHYCRATRTRTVSPGRPLARDISIFGEAGGYTFRRAGVHRVWAELDLRSPPALRSNAIEVNMLPLTKLEKAVQAALPLFVSRRGRIVLYHRTDEALGATLPEFEALAADYPRSVLAAETRYAVGRAQISVADHCGNAEERAHRLELARLALQIASEDARLSEHKRRKSRQLLDARPGRARRAHRRSEHSPDSHRLVCG